MGMDQYLDRPRRHVLHQDGPIHLLMVAVVPVVLHGHRDRDLRSSGQLGILLRHAMLTIDAMELVVQIRLHVIIVLHKRCIEYVIELPREQEETFWGLTMQQGRHVALMLKPPTEESKLEDNHSSMLPKMRRARMIAARNGLNSNIVFKYAINMATIRRFFLWCSLRLCGVDIYGGRDI